MMRTLEVYTDGSCRPNPGVGGWGWVSYEENTIVSDYGGLMKTTNNQMELSAVAEFLESCPHGNRVTVNIYVDSEYVLGGIIGKNAKSLTRVENKPQGWMRGWVRKNVIIGTHVDSYWNKEIKNSGEWYRIHQSLLKHAEHKTILNFCWVKGHSDTEGNDEADRLSNLFREFRK